MEPVEYYETSDLSLATTLSLEHTLIDVKREFPNSRKAVFVFEDSDELREMVEMFWTEELQVSPLKYFNQLRMVKARLYENR